MKFQFPAAALLVAAAGSASGAVLKDGATPGTPSDVLIAIYDSTSGKTFLYNTGLSYGDFANAKISTKTIQLGADPNFQAINIQGAKLKLNIVGGYSLADNYSNFDNTGSSGKIFSDAASTQWGLVTTAKDPAHLSGAFGALSDTTKSRIVGYWNSANVKLAAAGATKTGGASSVLVDKGDPQASFDLAWGGNFGGGAVAKTATANLLGGAGDTAKFYWVTNNDFKDIGAVIELGTWSVNASGRLVYAAKGYSGATNHAPVANAGASQSVATGATVTLNGSATDEDGDPLTYIWTKASGPDATLSGAASAKASFKAATAGTYVFNLTVSDGELSNTASVQVVATAGTTPTPTPTPAPTGPGLKLSVPATWKVGKAQAINFSGTQIAANAKVTVQYARNGTKFKTLKNLLLGKRGLSWKPVKADVSTSGVIKACATYDKKKAPVCDQVKVVVQPKK